LIITWKLAVMLVFEFKVTVRGLAVDPVDHPLKLYPELGVAVKLTCVPLANVPPPVTDPPSPAEAVKAYCLTICVGGVLGAWESSLAQVRMNNKLMYIGNFFID
jgi:hypothetical protein